MTGYLLVDKADILEEQKTISSPIRSPYGWHVIELVQYKKTTLNGYADLLQKSEFKDIENAKEQALSKAKSYWQRLLDQKLQVWQSEIDNQYALKTDLSTVIENNWKEKKDLISNNRFTITANDLESFIKWIAQDQGLKYDFVAGDLDKVKRYLQILLEIKAFGIVAEENGVFKLEKFKKREEFEKSRFLAELYKKEHWYEDSKISDAEILAEYNKMKKMGNQRKTKIPALSEVKDNIEHQLQNQRKMSAVQSNEEELLASIDFKLNENEFTNPPEPATNATPTQEVQQ
jgi:hypothetical protein